MKLDNLKFKDLDFLIAVSESNSVRDLARQTGVNPSRISRQIRAIEERAGCEFFARDPSGIRLTRDGAHLLAQMRELTQMAERVQRSSMATQVRPLKVSLDPVAAPWLLPVVYRSIKVFDDARRARFVTLPASDIGGRV